MSIKIFGQPDEKTLQQIQQCIDAEEGAQGVLCADNHLGYSMPIGGVVGYREHISPSGVGYDIGCGNMAVRTNIHIGDVTRDDMLGFAREIEKRVSFGIGRINDEPVDDPVITRIASTDLPEQRKLVQIAQQQLGTVGSGNHYVDILEDENGYLWVAVHFGSRGFGHKTATGFLNLAKNEPFDAHGKDGEMMSPPVLFDVRTPLGEAYIEAMTVAGEYAYAGRQQVVRKVLDIMGAQGRDEVHNHHNYAWKQEQPDGSFLWVVRKGATPAFPGQRGFVGGSMGDISVILEGVESPESREALYSTVHGAGRLLSRRKAKGRTKIVRRWKCSDARNCTYTAAKGGFFKEDGGVTPKCPKCGHKLRLTPMEEQLTSGLVDWTTVQQNINNMGIILRGAGADEAPECYRPLASVLDAHKNTIKILHVLKPRIVVMAGHDVFDPYKD